MENSKMAAEIQNCHVVFENSQYFVISMSSVSVSITNPIDYSKSPILNCSDKCAIKMIKNFKMVAN